MQISGRFLFKKSKVIIWLGVKLFSVFPMFIRILLWDIISPFSQLLFIGIRYLLLSSMINECGKNVKIGKNVTIMAWHNLKVGNNVSIHANCYIDASGYISIGNNVSIAHNTSILSTNHTWANKTIPIKYNDVDLMPVSMGNDIWIGCGCRILAGVNIQNRVIIAAGAVVNKDCESNYIYGGIPSKILKNI